MRFTHHPRDPLYGWDLSAVELVEARRVASTG